ncbi:unnamed protein product, partial [Ectocarpus sp. 13 AM-2016]
MVEKRVMKSRASVMGFLIYFCAIPRTQRLRESTIKALPLQSLVGSYAECFPVQQFLVDRARGGDKNYKHGKQRLLPPAQKVYQYFLPQARRKQPQERPQRVIRDRFRDALYCVIMIVNCRAHVVLWPKCLT